MLRLNSPMRVVYSLMQSIVVLYSPKWATKVTNRKGRVQKKTSHLEEVLPTYLHPPPINNGGSCEDILLDFQFYDIYLQGVLLNH